MVTFKNDNENSNSSDWRKSLVDFYNHHPSAYSLTIGFLAFSLGLVAMGLITFPNRVEPNNLTGDSNDSSPPTPLVKVNLFCEWTSQARLNEPIYAAIVKVKSARTGNNIPTLGNNIDTNGRVTFSMNKNEE